MDGEWALKVVPMLNDIIELDVGILRASNKSVKKSFSFAYIYLRFN